ncbi:ATP-binding cassette domain-containing protein [Faecalispora jeddahensis]|uniref:ATP-binding cassette domain-containing protein n=1 Tax=Faecalispora jeddahensis TaxID=1414721 RepID=UPI001897C075|nr:ATP-binding cassette domain-containing protein [Faecalispora jeddahensis]
MKKHNKTKEAVDKGIDSTVNKEKFFIFLGPNGAGKPRLYPTLTTTFSKTSGEVSIAGYDV